MAYKRRYLSGQEATTIDISEGAITPDKISDGAVITRTIADVAVTAEKIANLSVGAEHIKPDAVETEKIKDGAVTLEKLSSEITPAVRPLTPGVSSEEIAAEAVTETKIKDDSISGSKIKAGAVGNQQIQDAAVTGAKLAAKTISGDKIADDSISYQQIQAGAITSSELANNSVSEGKIINGSVSGQKLSAGAVSGDKIANLAIKDQHIDFLAVREPKTDTAILAARHEESYLVRNLDIREDFRGCEISNRWRRTQCYDSYILPTDKGLKFVTPSAAMGFPIAVDFGGKGITGHGRKLLFSSIISDRVGSLSNLGHKVGLQAAFIDPWTEGDLIRFYQDKNHAGARWYAQAREGGNLTSVDTGVDITTDPQILGIEWNSPTNVRFYIDGLQVAEITTNIPNSSILDPFIELKNHAAAAVSMVVPMITLQREREE